MENIIVIEEKVILPETPLCEQTVTIPCIKGDKGDKGDPLTYDDLTPEQIEELQRPAIEAAETTREEAETQRAEAETSRRQKFSQMETTVNSLVEETTEAKNDATKAATNANEAADKANQAAESIAYKENGFYISHAFLEATDLRYIGFKEIKNDKTCYLLTMGRCLKFSLDTYEVFWDVKLEGYGTRWHEAAEQLRVIDDTVYIICTKWNDQNSGIWLIKLNEEDGAFISEELIPIPVQYSYRTFKNKEVLITKDYIYGVDSVNKQILRCSVEDKAVEVIDSIAPAVSFPVLGNRWITLPDGSVKYALVWISAKNHIKIADEDNNLYSIELTFSNNNTQITTSLNTYIHNIDLKHPYLNFIISVNRYIVGLTNEGNNVFSDENIGVRNSYQNFPYDTEFYGNSMAFPNFDTSTNILSVTNSGFYRPVTNKNYLFVPNYSGAFLAATLSTSNTQIRHRIEIINTL